MRAPANSTPTGQKRGAFLRSPTSLQWPSYVTMDPIHMSRSLGFAFQTAPLRHWPWPLPRSSTSSPLVPTATAHWTLGLTCYLPSWRGPFHVAALKMVVGYRVQHCALDPFPYNLGHYFGNAGFNDFAILSIASRLWRTFRKVIPMLLCQRMSSNHIWMTCSQCSSFTMFGNQSAPLSLASLSTSSVATSGVVMERP